MRVACLPLDSRPANLQFPVQIGRIAGIEVLTPPREWLGSLHEGADGLRLANWLAEIAAGCDAALIAWDALLYGGLIQSRQPQRPAHAPQSIARILAQVDWGRIAGYSFSVVPRLGISVTSQRELAPHRLVQEYMELTGDSEAAERRLEIELKLGEETVRELWIWRRRNQEHNLAVGEICSALGFRHHHYAVEDNAARGPHIEEAAQLLASFPGSGGCSVSSFDGTDEALSVLLAMAQRAMRKGSGKQRVALHIHPALPGPERYMGRYESKTLQQGLDFLGSLLGFEYVEADGQVNWLITYGKQPQPDAFSSDPAQIFSNPYLLPRALPASGSLFVTDLAACNAGNPRLAELLLREVGGRLASFTAFNTNFNALGLSAAIISLADGEEDSPVLARFLIARLADDVVYQGISRPAVLAMLTRREEDSTDFSRAAPFVEDECLALVRREWLRWLDAGGAALLEKAGLNPDYARSLDFSFPWRRAFEIEVIEP